MQNGDKNMKRILILLPLVLAAVCCHQPEYVEPTAERQGITSLTAYFTFGPYEDQELARLEISDPDQTRYVIPVPYYYPEASTDETLIYMTKVRVRAELQPNCLIDPPLTVLDLLEENQFTYTDARGNSQTIVITGERVQSAKCELLTFDIIDPPISGIVDNTQHKVSLVSADDLSAARAKVSVSAHASVTPDLTEAHNYNEGLTFTVVAANGQDKQEYTVVKEIPEKIEYGFNPSSVKPLFNFDPVSNLGMPAYTEQRNISLAVLGNQLVVGTGDDTAPLLLNKLTGQQEGSLDLGGAQACCITSDEGGHLLLCNHSEPGTTLSIWVTESASAEPELLYSFQNETDLPMGAKMRVIGDIATEAQIVITMEGVATITSSSRIIVLRVEEGEVVSQEEKDLSASGLSWGEAPVHNTTVCGVSTDPSAGWVGAAYSENAIHWIKADGSNGAICGTSAELSWAWNPNRFDSKRFNNATYLSLLVVSHFPQWGIGPQLYVYDITSPAGLTGEFTSSSALVLANDALSWYQTGAAGIADGDVVMAPSSDGFMIYVYYYDHNAQSIGGYSADCIKR